MNLRDILQHSRHKLKELSRRFQFAEQKKNFIHSAKNLNKTSAHFYRTTKTQLRHLSENIAKVGKKTGKAISKYLSAWSTGLQHNLKKLGNVIKKACRVCSQWLARSTKTITRSLSRASKVTWRWLAHNLHKLNTLTGKTFRNTARFFTHTVKQLVKQAGKALRLIKRTIKQLFHKATHLAQRLAHGAALFARKSWRAIKLFAAWIKTATIKDIRYIRRFLNRAFVFFIDSSIYVIKFIIRSVIKIITGFYTGLEYIVIGFAYVLEYIWDGSCYIAGHLWRFIYAIAHQIKQAIRKLYYGVRWSLIKLWLGSTFSIKQLGRLLKATGQLLLKGIKQTGVGLLKLFNAIIASLRWLAIKLWQLVVAIYHGFIATVVGLSRGTIKLAKILFRYFRILLVIIDWAIEAFFMVLVYLVRKPLEYLWLALVFIYKLPKRLLVLLGQRFDKPKQYALLVRLDKPIGIYLLLWPTLIALWIAAKGIPDLYVLFVFVAGTVLMRSAGCAINDYADRDIDNKVKRTKDRPLTSGKITGREAIIIFCILGATAFALVCTMNALTIAMSTVGIVLAGTYPFMKRYHYLPQVHLGAAFGWAVPMAYVAQTGELEFFITGLLFLTTLLWTTAYDTMYAMVDYDYDIEIGVKSTAILFGDLDRHIIGIIQIMVIFSLILIGHKAELSGFYFTGVFIASLFSIYQQFLIYNREPDDCFKAFLNNNYFGMVLFIAVACEYQFATLKLS